jgi:hypothetical protein
VVAAVLAPLWLPALALFMRYGMGWRIVGAKAARAEYRRLRTGSAQPLLVCANHLTMVDSAVIAWALGSAAFLLLHPASLPWNVPDRENFGKSWWQRALVYAMKCLPIPRGGDRREVAVVLQSLAWILGRGEVGLVFPEGGRARSGRVEIDSRTYGVGRILGSVPDCRVLCVYLRGEGQRSWSRVPARGERFHVSFAEVEPKSDAAGLRRSVALTQQVLARLVDLEAAFFDARK